jgi:hypothetical protein
VTEQQPPAEPARCGVCTGPIVDTPIGWTHVDIRGVLIGWLCPMPHMALAQPRDLRMGEADALLGSPVPASNRHHGTAHAYSGL